MIGESQSLAGSASGGPLSGITVLDMGIYRSAPHCSLILARLGADVIIFRSHMNKGQEYGWRPL